MSAGSRRAREVPALADADTVRTGSRVDAWQPDWQATCRACGATPCMTGLRRGRVVCETHLCEACAFDHHALEDP